MLVAKPDIEKEDMNAVDKCNDALLSPRPPPAHTQPVAKLNQMGKCTCYLKRSGGPPHQIILPVLQKEGCIWQYGPSDRNHRIDVATTEQLGSQLNLTLLAVPKTEREWGLCRKGWVSNWHAYDLNVWFIY